MGEVVEDGEGIVDMAREDEVADNKTAIGAAVAVDLDARAYLTYHLPEGVCGHLGVVRSVAVSGGDGGVHVFEVGEVDVDKAFEGAECRHALVAGGIIDDSGGDCLIA